jgi:hypothetical protein
MDSPARQPTPDPTPPPKPPVQRKAETIAPRDAEVEQHRAEGQLRGKLEKAGVED